MIEFKDVTKKFDDYTALDKVSFKIENGTAFGLLGSNGAGKSTILRLISGIYEQNGGDIIIDGESVYDNPSAKGKVFFISDETILLANMTLNDMKFYYKGFYPNFSDELFEKLRETVKLPLNVKTEKFSKGMKRQAIVITALACQTEYLLLDEAFDGLDPTMRIIVKRMLVDAMLDRKMTAVISSHNLKEINEICDSAALFHQGRMLFCHELDKISGNIHKIQAAFGSDCSQEDFSDLEILHFEKRKSVTILIVKGDEAFIRCKLNEKHPLILDILPLSLEEIFIYEMEGQGYDFKGIE